MEEDELGILKRSRAEFVELLTSENDPVRRERIQRGLDEIGRRIAVLENLDA